MFLDLICIFFPLLFKPTLSWTALANLINPRELATAVWLPDGRIFVIGGDTKGGLNYVWTDSVEQCLCPWNVAISTRFEWSLATPMPNALKYPQACHFQDSILVVGEGNRDTFSPCLRMDTSQRGQWTALHHLTVYGRPSSLMSTGDELFATSESFSTQFVSLFSILTKP